MNFIQLFVFFKKAIMKLIEYVLEIEKI